MLKIAKLLERKAKCITDPATRNILINRMCLVLTGLALFFGLTISVVGEMTTVLYPILIESFLFLAIYCFNRKGNHTNLAALAVICVNNMAVVYFSIILGKQTEVWILLPFFFCFTFLFLELSMHRAISMGITILALVLAELNAFLEFFPPLITDHQTLYLTRWIAILGILILDIIVGYLSWVGNRLELKAKENDIEEKFHEMRNPLDVATKITEVLIKEGTPEQKEGLMQQLRQLTICSQTINKALDYSKVKAGKFQINYATVDVNALAYDLIKGQQILATLRSIKINLVCNMSPRINADPQALIRILNNLISNAIKFSPQNSSIDVTIREAGSEWMISVRDSGFGIPKEKHAQIFKQYFSEGGRNIGSGIGLFLVKKLVTAMGETIKFTSITGEGTTFEIFLPLILAEGNLPLGISEKKKLEEVVYLNGFKILLIEDSDMSRCWTERLLRGYHINLVTAENSVEGIEKARIFNPDLILMDLNTTPCLNDVDAISSIKRNKLLAHIPIILTTGACYNEAIEHALSEGASSYLIKPISERTLISEINNVLMSTEVTA